MLSARASSLMVLLLGSIVSINALPSITAAAQMTGGLATGWAIQYHGIKPICKLAMEDAAIETCTITLKVAMGEVASLYIKNISGGTKVPTWFKNSMRFPLYYEIGSTIYEAYGMYFDLPENTKNLSSDTLNQIIATAKDHPVLLKGMIYLAYGYVNAQFTTAISTVFMNELIPDRIVAYEKLGKAAQKQEVKEILKDHPTWKGRIKTFEVDGQELKYRQHNLKHPYIHHINTDLIKKLGGVFSGTFASTLIKNYTDSFGICRNAQEKEKAFYNAMYMIGLKIYFATKPLHDLSSDIRGIFA
jgi:hypothetical protein